MNHPQEWILNMTVRRNDIHLKQVEAWELKNAESVSASERPRLYAKAIQAIERRSLATLSHVTVLVVVDRAICETIELFPVLSRIKATTKGLDFSALLSDPDENRDELANAFRELLIELLNVLGNITADVLTIPLHKELIEVTNERPLFVAETQTLHSVNSATKKREQK